MIRLAFRTLRFRKGGFIATFVAVVFGTAIVMACGGLMETGIRTNIPAERLAAAPIVVTGKQSHLAPGADSSTPLPERVGIPADLVGTVRAVPGVAEAVGDVSFPATAVHDGQVVTAAGQGHDWASAHLAPYRLTSGTPPRGSGDVVLDTATANQLDVKLGSSVELLVRGEPRIFVVRGIADGPAGHTFFAGREAARLADRPGQLDTIAVMVASGTDIEAVQDRIKDAVDGRAVVLAGADRGVAEHPEAADKETLIAVAGSFGGIATLTMMFVVASTLALSVQQRQREFALLRGIGTTPGQVRRMILGEAMAVSLPAVLVGCLPGLVLGRFLFDQLAENGVASPLVMYRQGSIPLAAGAGAAVLAAIGAGVIAGRRAAKARPVEALAEASLQRQWFSWVRLVFGLAFLGGAVALMIITATVLKGPLAAATAGPAVLCWTFGLALLGPAVTKAVFAVLRWPVRLVSGVNGRLAILNVTARTVAMSAAVMPVMLATGIATANLYMQTTQVDAAEKAFTEGLRADAVLVSTAGGLAPDLLSRVRATPGVASASAYVTSSGVIDQPRGAHDEDGILLQGISAQGADGTAPVKLTSGSLAGLTGTTVALPTRVADKLDLKPGDSIRMTLGDGTAVEPRVVATFETKPGYDSVLLPAALVADHTTAGLPDQIMVRAAAGTDPAQLTKALAGVTSSLPGVAVADREALLADTSAGLQTQAWINYLLIGMIIAYTGMSVINTLVSATVRRRREFGLQRLTGSTRVQVLRMVTVEGLLVAAAGIALGTLIAVATLLPFSSSVSDSAMPSGPLWIYLTIAGTAAALTIGATVVPAWLTLRTRPAEAAAWTD